MSVTHASFDAEFPLSVSRSAGEPLPVQLAQAFRDAIDRGTLRAGEALPATRALAARLGVARGVVVTAYEQLIAEGYLQAGQGRGTVVHHELARPHEHPAHHLLRTPSAAGARVDRPERGGGDATSAADRLRRSAAFSASTGPLAPGIPDTSAVDSPAWRQSWRAAIARAHVQAPELGDPRLRAEIAEHLRRMRGTQRSAVDVMVTAGARDGLDLLLTALTTERGRGLTVGVEDPGYPSLRRVAARTATAVIALPVDASGVDPQALPGSGLDLVIVTPSHQYPFGGSLPLARRRDLIAWARRAGAVIVEDDYDGELRHTGSPMPAMAALDDPDAGVVALLGTFSKTLSPALAAGYLLAPATLRAIIEPVRHDLGGPVSAVVQGALADYLASGALRRHTARMRRRYAVRRSEAMERLRDLPALTVRPMSGGLHVVLEFAPSSANAPATGASDACAERERLGAERSQQLGLGAVALSTYWHEEVRPREARSRYGLVIGTGGADAEQYAHALGQLRDILLE